MPRDQLFTENPSQIKDCQKAREMWRGFAQDNERAASNPLTLAAVTQHLLSCPACQRWHQEQKEKH